MWLPWEYGLLLAIFCFVASRATQRRQATAAAFLHEAGIIAVLYALWQLAGRLSLLSIEPAISRGAALWDFERFLRLPNEATLQQWMVPHSLLTQAANIYYAGVHVPAMGVFLVWLFLRRRLQYSVWRNTLAFTTATCLIIQLYPVAPPRLTEQTAMIDTGLAYGQSVYGVLGRGIAGQLQAMPSIHVGWAALIGWATWRESTSVWRWLGPTHFAITFVAVAVTGNHYWLDGIVAMVLLWLSWHLSRWIHARVTPKMLATAAVGVVAAGCASAATPQVLPAPSTTPTTTLSEQMVPEPTGSQDATTSPTTTAVSELVLPEQAGSDTPSTMPGATVSETEIPVEVMRTGAEIAAANGFTQWAGSKVGVIAHSASITADGTHIADLINDTAALELVALFGPEHGIRGNFGAGELVADGSDPQTGVPIFSLYGQTRSPTTSMLTDIDVLFYDLQDVGTRYYTYISTMGLAMQAAVQHDITFVVLDRPNPLGDRREGDLLTPDNRSFVGMYEIPEVYGLTSGELARAIVGEGLIDGLETLDLDVVNIESWDRSGWPEDRPWVAPSPAITSLETALLYPATVVFEATTLNYGRGTELPFELIGAPWLDGEPLAKSMNELGLTGVQFEAVNYTPKATTGSVVAHAGQELRGLRLRVTDHRSLRPTEVAVRLLEQVVVAGADAGVPITSIIDRPNWLAMLTGTDGLYRWIEDPENNPDPVTQRVIDTAEVRSMLDAYRPS